MSQQFLPLLKPENIDELKSLILEIMEDNDSKLEKIIQNRQIQAVDQGYQFTLEDLNELLSEQCLQKQKVVSNLSHFALSLMNTIEILWQNNEDLEYKIKDQRQVIRDMDNHFQQVTKEVDDLKNKLYLAYNDIQKIDQQKHALEEYLSSLVVKHEKSFDCQQNNKISQNPEQKRMNAKVPQFQYQQNSQYRNSNYDEISIIKQADKLKYQKQNSISHIQKEKQQKFDENEGDLLENSIIKDSISILKRYTLADDAQNKLTLLEESDSNIKFIEKSNRFSLIQQISLQIFQTQNPSKPIEEQKHAKSFVQQRSLIRDLKMSNEKINITIGTGTQLTKTNNSDENYSEHCSMIQPSPSCTSFLMSRQSSAIMYPSLERSNSTMSFVTHTTKLIQTDFPRLKQPIRKDFKKTQSKSIAVDTYQSENPETKNERQIQAKGKKESTINHTQTRNLQQSSNKKSFSQLLDYFTKKIVSDRIRTNHKKKDLQGFKKTKSNIQKVF